MNNSSESRTPLQIESYFIAGPAKGVCLIFANAKYSGKVKNLSESGVNTDINTLTLIGMQVSGNFIGIRVTFCYKVNLW